MKTYPTFRPAASSALERASMPTTCECCGRENLKRTVKMTDGAQVLWMGVGCAAKGTGMSTRELSKAEREAQDAFDSAEFKVAEQARRERFARWSAHLDARCPAHKGEVFLQIRALGGMASARLGFVDA